MHYEGLIIALSTFVIIGIFHPIVIKVEYYSGTRYWYLFLIAGISCLLGALFVSNIYISSLLGITGASSLWSIGELFQQRKRVQKGWFPKNPNRIKDYE